MHVISQLEPPLLFKLLAVILYLEFALSDSNPSAFVNVKKISIPNLASFRGQFIPIILHGGFRTGHYHIKSIHQLNPFPGALNIFDLFSETPIL